MTTGIYSISRHPVYTASLAAFTLLYLLVPTVSNLVLLVGGGGYFIIGSIPEEKKLEKIFENYNDYRQNVGRFFPWKRKHWDFLSIV